MYHLEKSSMLVAITHGLPGDHRYLKFMLVFNRLPITCTHRCTVEARAALWNRLPKVEVGEAQGAEDSLGREERQQTDEDEAEKGEQGGGQHCPFDLGLTEIEIFTASPNCCRDRSEE